MVRARIRRFLGLALIALFATVSLGACGGSDDQPSPESLIGSQAPALSGEDLTATGVDDLADLVGKPTAVVFWLNTCPHCQDDIPAIQDAWADLADDYNILTVGMMNEDVVGEAGYETPEAFVGTVGLAIPTVAATWDTVQADWRLTQVPVVFILNDQHVIEDVVGGEDDLVGAIEESLRNVDLECCGA